MRRHSLDEGGHHGHEKENVRTSVGRGAADVFLEMITQPFPGFDGIVLGSSNRVIA